MISLQLAYLHTDYINLWMTAIEALGNRISPPSDAIATSSHCSYSCSSSFSYIPSKSPPNLNPNTRLPCVEIYRDEEAEREET